MFNDQTAPHDAYAHGPTTLLCVARNDFQKILSIHVELYEALMRLQARRIRQLFGLVEDLNTLPLRARLAKQLLHLARSYGVPCLSDGNETRIGLQLAQEEFAQLLGASRQRVNQELKAMEREGAIRIEPGGLVVRLREKLLRISKPTPDSSQTPAAGFDRTRSTLTPKTDDGSTQYIRRHASRVRLTRF